MEWMGNFIFWSIIIISSPILILLSRHKSRDPSQKLPPGPKGWPVIGNIFDLGITLPHRSLLQLKQQYGPVVWLKLGSTNTMVILTATAATELFKNHDLTISDRKIVSTMKSHDYYKSSMIMAPYGGYWRALKRVCTVEMFASKRMKDGVLIRQKCVNDILTWIGKDAAGDSIELKQFVFASLFNMVANVVVSRDLVDHPHSLMASEFYAAMEGISECMGTANVSDLFPCLEWFDLQALRRKMDIHMGQGLKIASGFVKERMKQRRKDVLDVLLDFKGDGNHEPAQLTQQKISVFLLEMFLAGTETISNTVEWAMSELILQPETMIKIKTELSKIVVGPKKMLEENDIDNMHYLQAVVKETLRLHPPAPLLVPRKTRQGTNFMGYNIPKDTQVIINAWAIGRDPERWHEPSVFKPERFLGSEVDYKGQHYELIPFGAGRRICPGLPLGDRMVPYILGSLIHEFEWELDDNVAKTMNLKETMGITARKLEPFKAIPKRSHAVIESVRKF